MQQYTVGFSLVIINTRFMSGQAGNLESVVVSSGGFRFVLSVI